MRNWTPQDMNIDRRTQDSILSGAAAHREDASFNRLGIIGDNDLSAAPQSFVPFNDQYRRARGDAEPTNLVVSKAGVSRNFHREKGLEQGRGSSAQGSAAKPGMFWRLDLLFLLAIGTPSAIYCVIWLLHTIQKGGLVR